MKTGPVGQFSNGELHWFIRSSDEHLHTE